VQHDALRRTVVSNGDGGKRFTNGPTRRSLSATSSAGLRVYRYWAIQDGSTEPLRWRHRSRVASQLGPANPRRAEGSPALSWSAAQRTNWVREPAPGPVKDRTPPFPQPDLSTHLGEKIRFALPQDSCRFHMRSTGLSSDSMSDEHVSTERATSLRLATGVEELRQRIAASSPGDRAVYIYT